MALSVPPFRAATDLVCLSARLSRVAVPCMLSSRGLSSRIGSCVRAGRTLSEAWSRQARTPCRRACSARPAIWRLPGHLRHRWQHEVAVGPNSTGCAALQAPLSDDHACPCFRLRGRRRWRAQRDALRRGCVRYLHTLRRAWRSRPQPARSQRSGAPPRIMPRWSRATCATVREGRVLLKGHSRTLAQAGVPLRGRVRTRFVAHSSQGELRARARHR